MIDMRSWSATSRRTNATMVVFALVFGAVTPGCGAPETTDASAQNGLAEGPGEAPPAPGEPSPDAPPSPPAADLPPTPTPTQGADATPPTTGSPEAPPAGPQSGPPPYVKQSSSPAEMSLQEGRQLAEQRNYFDARQRFQAAAQADPSSATAWYNLAMVQWRTGSAQEAIASLRKSITINPTFSRAVYLLAIIQIRSKQPDEALQTVDQALATRKGDVMLRAAKAEALLARKRPLEAQQVLIDAIKLDYDNPELLRLLGATYLDLGREGLALLALNKAFEFYTGEAEKEAGVHAAAEGGAPVTKYDQRRQRGGNGLRGPNAEALTKDEGLAHIYYLFGQIALRKDKIEEARRHFLKAVEYRADYPEAWNNLGLTWVAAKRDQDAIDALTRALELDPDSFEARVNLGNAYRISKLSDKALKAKAEYERAMKQDPRHPAPHFNMGILYLENKDLMEDNKARLLKAIDYFNVYRNLAGTIAKDDPVGDYIDECKNLIKIAEDQVKAEAEAKKYQAEEKKRLEEEARRQKEEDEKNKAAQPPAEGGESTPSPEGDPAAPAPPPPEAGTTPAPDAAPPPPPATTDAPPPPARDVAPPPPPPEGDAAAPAPPAPDENKDEEAPPAPPAPPAPNAAPAPPAPDEGGGDEPPPPPP